LFVAPSSISSVSSASTIPCAVPVASYADAVASSARWFVKYWFVPSSISEVVRALIADVISPSLAISEPAAIVSSPPVTVKSSASTDVISVSPPMRSRM
jgi:hypothetical protein